MQHISISQTRILSAGKILVLGLLLGLGLQFAQSWNPPGNNPPNNNVSGPITAGNTAPYQTRAGGLGLTGSLNVMTVGMQNNKITTPKICLNNDGTETNCITSWPAGGAGAGSPMLAGWPDAIRCEMGTAVQYFYLSGYQPDELPNGKVRYSDPYSHNGSGPGAYAFNFDKDGNWSGHFGGALAPGMGGCVGKSITDLSNLGWTFNFGGSGGSSDNLGNQIADAIHGLNMSNTTIFNLANPIKAHDAATKGYVDSKIGGGGSGVVAGCGCTGGLDCSVSSCWGGASGAGITSPQDAVCPANSTPHISGSYSNTPAGGNPSATPISYGFLCIAGNGGGSNVTEPIAWVHATASVKPGVEYQNSTGKRMMLLVKDTGGGDSRLRVYVYPAKPYKNTDPLFANSNESGGDLVSTTAIIPDGWYYYVYTITNGGPNYRAWTTAF